MRTRKISTLCEVATTCSCRAKQSATNKLKRVLAKKKLISELKFLRKLASDAFQIGQYNKDITSNFDNIV